ncbi:hypothetical protein QMK33_17715 [Hymenobacter sp. H14-R3]|uniref:hypothetical protein n=1 Tax=Hymenobacter sp. H14-R3 TaxID=3046308 RepID=UPI0024BA484F|nr:hypothetical protein [Hymenobacter sp. H14-R3]MDJ0366990.1 hypothetical protein [Hymenobacter sp. H14-R3]
MAVPSPPAPSAATGCHWVRWLLAGLALVILAALSWLKWGLDPWLRRQLTQQVTKQTHGQYTLAVNDLRTELLARSLHLRGVVLRPATPTLADTLPRLEARLARLDLHGVGLLALWRGTTAPIDSLTLDSLRLEVAALARRPAPARPGAPFYQQHPLRLGYLALRRVGGRFGPAGAPVAQLAAATVRARDLLISPAGVTDTERLALATDWQATLHEARVKLGGHTIATQALYFASDKQSLGIDSLHITPPAPGQGKPGALQVAFTMPRARMQGLQAATWQHQHRLRADSVRLTGPHLTFKPPTKAPPPLWQLLKPLFRRADVRQVVIDDGYLAVAGVREAPAVRHLFLTGRSLRIDSVAEQPAARRVLYARAWAGHAGRITATFLAPVYPVSVERAFLDTDTQALRLTALAMRPTLTPAQLNRHSGYQTTQLTVRIAELRAQGFDFQQLSANSHLRIARVMAEQPHLLTNSDGRGPINRRPSFLTPEAVRRVRAHFDVGQLELRNGTILAQFRGARTPLLGTFSINRLNATLRNVSNDPARMSLAHPLTGTVTGYLQNTCRAEIQLTTSLLDPRGRQHLWGSFGPAPFSVLNPALRPTKLISFKSGQVQHIDFDERLDRQHIRGEVRAYYTDLRINFLGYDEGEVKKTLFGRLKSGVVNVVVRDQNPRPGGRLVVGEIDSRREPEFSAFTAWRQGLISGFLHNVGVPKKIATSLGHSDGGTALPPGPYAPIPASAQPSEPAGKGLLHKPIRWVKKAIRRVKKLGKRVGRAIAP